MTQPGPRAPFSLRNRSIYWWLNVGFVLIIGGLLIGASEQVWYVLVAVAWVIAGGVVTARSRRSRPQPPSLFDDDPSSPPR